MEHKVKINKYRAQINGGINYRYGYTVCSLNLDGIGFETEDQAEKAAEEAIAKKLAEQNEIPRH